MKFIRNSLRISKYLSKKKKLPIWAHPYKDLFHSDIAIISHIENYASFCINMFEPL